VGTSIKISALDGRSFEGYLALPADRGPGLLVLPEMFNVNSTIRLVAEDYATKGFVALAPDMYWRTRPGLYLEYGRENSPRGRELYDGLDRQHAVSDIDRCVSFLRNDPRTNGKVAIVGFCMGGEVALLFGCRHQVDAIAIYYGTRMETHLAEIPRLAAPTIMHFAELDPYVPAATVTAVQAATRPLDHVATYVYGGVDHTFARPNQPQFEEAATRLADQRTMALFKPLFL
jgi:carboxymethylenebutenolidase